MIKQGRGLTGNQSNQNTVTKGIFFLKDAQKMAKINVFVMKIYRNLQEKE